MTLQERETLVCEFIDSKAQVLMDLGRYIHANPELGLEEYKAVEAIRAFLEKEGFRAEVGLTNRPQLKTAMRAQSSLEKVKKMAFLGEYDALPGLGHGCGHNLIAIMSLGAALAFDKGAKENWQGVFLGCPAEETLGGKVYMAEAGLFKDYQGALIMHPAGANEVGGTSLATHPLEVTYYGRSAHVASLTDSGLNALDSAVRFYLAVRDLKKTLPKGVRIGTIFTDGGEAPNVIPGRAQVHMTVRAKDADTLENIVLPAIKTLAQDIAGEEGTRLEMRHYEPLFKDLRQDARLISLFTDVMTEFGQVPTILPDDEADGSTDVGNVSYDIPTAQPSLNIGLGLEAHTPEFACAAGSEFGLQQAIVGAKIMAVTALRFAEELDRN